MPHHAALIGDIRGSRELDNWPEVFGLLKQTLREVNRRFKDEILVKFAPTVGDEFQGALKTPDRAFDVHTFIKASLPVPIYCGLGIGEVEIASEGSVGLRGTAFYRAREALEVCKNERGGLRVISSDGELLADQTINAMLRLMEAIETSWTARQREIVYHYRLHPNLTYERLGTHFGVSKPFVHKVLKATRFASISRSEQLITELLTANQSSAPKG